MRVSMSAQNRPKIVGQSLMKINSQPYFGKIREFKRPFPMVKALVYNVYRALRTDGMIITTLQGKTYSLTGENAEEYNRRASKIKTERALWQWQERWLHRRSQRS